LLIESFGNNRRTRAKANTMSRLSPVTLLVAVVAILLAFAGAFTVRQYIERQAAVEEVAAEPMAVPVAAIDLKPGREIRESDLSTIRIPLSQYPQSPFAKKIYISDVAHLKGRMLRRQIKAGDSLGPDDLYPEGTGPTVAEQLPAGMRAVTVKVSGSGFVDGFAGPGTEVDVLFRSSEEDDARPETTITALHGIQVLAVDSSPYPLSLPGSNSLSTTPVEDVLVTFAVLPTEATMLKALEDRGEISLSLRPDVDAGDAVAKVEAVGEPERHAQTLTSILEGAKIPLVAVATTELMQGRVVRAGDVRLVERPAGATDGDETTFSDAESLVGRVLRSEVTPGTVLTAALLYAEGVGPGVADRLPPGFRAITVKMDQAALVDGFVSPGTKVDVFFRADKIEGYPETTLRVLDGLEVLAIEDRVAPGAASDQDDTDLRVTLAVPLGDVGKVQALEGHGVMTLAVRATEERPIGEIVRDLDKTTQELEKTQRQIVALKQISQLDGSITLSKEQTERLDTLIAEVPELERRLESLGDEKDAATSGASQTTLAEVLNLPEPSRPATLEIYNGGSRETLVFSSSQQSLSTSRTASRAPSNPAKVKNTNAKVKSKAPASDVSKKVDGKVGVEKVSLSTPPNRKVSASFKETSTSESVAKRPSHGDQGSSILTSVREFGKGLVVGLSKARQSVPRVEIVRGGVKD
jgi:Flp pilus assembly protein CpaB